MTSSTGTDQHPDVAEISALTEGLLPPDRTADVRSHLADCALCCDVRSSLDEIRALLGTLPGPARTPADIAGRIDAALAAEALLDATMPASVSRETDVGSTPGANTGVETADVSRETTASAHSSHPMNRPHGHPRDSAGPGRGPRIRRRWRTAVFGTAGVLAVTGLGAAVVQAINAFGSDSSSHSAAAGEADVGEAPGLSARGVESHVQRLLANADTAMAPSGELGTQSSPAQPMRPMRGSGTAVPACVREGAGRADAPIASDQITYQGTDAYLVVLPRGADPVRVDVFVIDSSCIGQSPQRPGDVLLKDIYERG